MARRLMSVRRDRQRVRQNALNAAQAGAALAVAPRRDCPYG
jgi:hypothetical protein